MSSGSDSSRYLPYGRQRVTQADIDAVSDVLRGDWLTTGPTVPAFERALAGACGAQHAVACSSGTAALHLATLVLDIQPGDQVIVPAQTFMATANAVRYAGADVIFCDVDERTGLMTAEHMLAALDRGTRVRAVYPVHLNGQAAPMHDIAPLARERGLAIVEDCCHALGAGLDDAGHRVGSCHWGDLGVFSFHPVKTVAMGEGGALTLNDAAAADRLRRLRSHGINHEHFQNTGQAEARLGERNPWYHEMQELGYNYRASDIHCALGLSQLARLEQMVARRRRLAEQYRESLAGLAPLIQPVAEVGYGWPAWHLFVVRIDFAQLGHDRGWLVRRLRDAGIGTQVHYIPVHWQPYYRKLYGTLTLPGAERYYESVLSLPLFEGMEPADVDRVAATLSGLCQ